MTDLFRHGKSGNNGNDRLLSCFFRSFRFFRVSIAVLICLLLTVQNAAAQGTHPVPPLGPRVFPDRYDGLSVAELRADDYGAGAFRIEDGLGNNGAFTRSLVSWDSDGLTVYGFMNVPEGEGPFPVVIVIHGYVEPSVYNTLTYTTRYADALARAGYVAIHPNLRGYPPSDDGPNEVRVGFARDILHLIAHIQEQAGVAGDPLALADAAHIGLWGHSMGGGITQRVLVTSDDVDAAILYGAMSGDEMANHIRIRDVFSDGVRGNWIEGEGPSDAQLRAISPINYLAEIDAAVSIHHGDLDDQVPLEWSAELAELLAAAGKTVEYYPYEGQPHTFVGAGDTLFIERMIAFYDQYLQD